MATRATGAVPSGTARHRRAVDEGGPSSNAADAVDRRPGRLFATSQRASGCKPSQCVVHCDRRSASGFGMLRRHDRRHAEHRPPGKSGHGVSSCLLPTSGVQFFATFPADRSQARHHPRLGSRHALPRDIAGRRDAADNAYIDGMVCDAALAASRSCRPKANRSSSPSAFASRIQPVPAGTPGQPPPRPR